MKKVLSLVLVIAMVLSSMSFAFAAKFEDIADIDYEEAINTLSALGVITGYEDGTFRPEKTVTRAEMAKLMVELLGYGDLVTGSKSNFTDTQGHWADQWIALAAGRGIVIGTGDGKFNPEGIVTYDQVLTMLVRGLGYTDASNELKNMTWPTNFKVKAAELNITKNVNMTSNNADRGGVAQAMFNALDQQLVKVNSDGDIVKEFTSKGSRTDIPVNLITRIAKPEYDFVVGFEHINPDDKNYAGDKVDLTQYLFQSVEAYFNKNNDDEVVYVGKVNSLTYSDEFESATFDKNGKLDELEVGDYTFDVVGSLVSYNNDELGLSKIESEDDLDGAKITVVLDKDETRVKDGAVISGIIVEKASAYVQIEEEYKADATEIDEIYLPVKSSKVDSKNLIVKGDATELADIEIDDIVAAYAPFGDDPTTDTPDKLTLVVSRNTVEGEVTGTAASGAYYIDKVKYETNDALGIETLEVGDEGVFYLDDAGKIIAFGDGSIGSKTYAVVYDIIEGEYKVTPRGVTVVSAPKIKLSTAANEKITYVLDVELEKVNETTAKVVGDLDKVLVASAGQTIKFIDSDKFGETYLFDKDSSGKVIGNLVSYTLNKSDEVAKLEVAGRKIDMKTNNASFVLASNAIIFNKDGKVIDEDDLGTKVTGIAAYQNGKIVALLARNVEDNTNDYYAYVSAAYKDQDASKNEIQRLTAFVKGAKTTTLLTDDKDMVSKGFHKLSINDNGIVVKVTSAGAFISGKVTDIDSRNERIEIDNNWKDYDSGSATIIEFDEDGTASVISKLSGIKKNTQIDYIVDGNVVVYIVINYEGDTTPVEEGKVTYINSTATRVVVDGTKTLIFDSNTEIYDEDGKIVAVGFEDIADRGALVEDDIVKDVKVSDGVVVSLTRIR